MVLHGKKWVMLGSEGGGKFNTKRLHDEPMSQKKRNEVYAAEGEKAERAAHAKIRARGRPTRRRRRTSPKSSSRTSWPSR